jgi:hypothetical protein
MPRASRTAIPPDEILQKPLGELTAAEFLTALSHPSVDKRSLAILPDKKKYELWVEEDGIPKISVLDLLDRLKGEKKKLELEKFYIEDIKMVRENVIDPIEILRDPVIIDRIAEQVAQRLGRG